MCGEDLGVMMSQSFRQRPSQPSAQRPAVFVARSPLVQIVRRHPSSLHYLLHLRQARRQRSGAGRVPVGFVTDL